MRVVAPTVVVEVVVFVVVVLLVVNAVVVVDVLVWLHLVTGAAANQCVTPRGVRRIGGFGGGGETHPPPKGRGDPPPLR